MSLKVLIVDDDDIVIFLHETLIDMSGLSSQPAIAINGKEALEYITKSQDDDDSKYLIFLDINMPVMNGWELLDEINTQLFSDRVFVVMVTSSTDAKDKEKSMTYKNVIDFLEKPLSIEDCDRIKFSQQVSSYF